MLRVGSGAKRRSKTTLDRPPIAQSPRIDLGNLVDRSETSAVLVGAVDAADTARTSTARSPRSPGGPSTAHRRLPSVVNGG